MDIPFTPYARRGILMEWEVEVTDEFLAWYDALPLPAAEAVSRDVDLLETYGTALTFPHSSAIFGSRHSHMRELRVDHARSHFRILYAFDPRRMAIVLLGGDKTGDDRWYEKNVNRADRLYDDYLDELRKEGLI
jgi:hypothetical protein